MKKTPLTLLAMGVMATLAACSPKKDKAGETTNASVVASTVVSAPAQAASQPVASVAPAIVASTVVVAPAGSTTAATPMSASAPTPASQSNVALKTDLALLFKTLNDLDRDTAAKQADMQKKMQNAKTPADQQAFFKEVLSQLELQKATLNKLKFNDARVTKARDKMVESIDSSHTGTQALVKNPTATPETHPEIAKAMQSSQKSAEQAKEMLMKLTEEAGMKAQLQAPTKQ